MFSIESEQHKERKEQLNKAVDELHDVLYEQISGFTVRVFFFGVLAGAVGAFIGTMAVLGIHNLVS